MNEALSVSILILEHGQGLSIPAYATPGSAGCDLMAAVDEALVLAPGERALVPTGFAMALPEGYEAQVRPRSGLAVRHGVTVLNAPGTIDSDYRGEVKVPVINLGSQPFEIPRGSRIAQMVVAPVVQVKWRLEADLQDTDRGSGGFGSTGI
jgi:dUTP pyrophosphatase